MVGRAHTENVSPILCFVSGLTHVEHGQFSLDIKKQARHLEFTLPTMSWLLT